MNANVLKFPDLLSAPPPKTQKQQRFDRIVELLVRRAQRHGYECTEEQARSDLTQLYLELAAGKKP